MPWQHRFYSILVMNGWLSICSFWKTPLLSEDETPVHQEMNLTVIRVFCQIAQLNEVTEQSGDESKVRGLVHLFLCFPPFLLQKDFISLANILINNTYSMAETGIIVLICQVFKTINIIFRWGLAMHGSISIMLRSKFATVSRTRWEICIWKYNEIASLVSVVKKYGYYHFTVIGRLLPNFSFALLEHESTGSSLRCAYRKDGKIWQMTLLTC